MIDHSGHPHPSTPSARAACRANGGTGIITKSSKSTPAKERDRTPSLKEPKIPVPKKSTPTPAPNTTTKEEITASEPPKSLRSDPQYVKDYNRGYRAGAGRNDLTRADRRGESDAFYDGFSDRSIGVPKWTRTEERDELRGVKWPLKKRV